MKKRLDVVLVEKGMASSRQVAQALILGGRVSVDGQRKDKPGDRVTEEADVSVAAPASPFVGRGGLKLAGALDGFGLDVTGAAALDVGASTGGFTDCLLQRGAARVWAIDVGHGQIDWRLRRDPRVVVLEGINARHLSAGDLPGFGDGADLAVVDVSFISLKLVLPRIPPLLKGGPVGCPILALVKPQFEVGRGHVGRGGVVRSVARRLEVLEGMGAFCLGLPVSVRGLARSCIEGAEGNVEYFLHLSTAPGGLTLEDIRQESGRITSEETVDA